jgi:hypothetical protein
MHSDYYSSKDECDKAQRNNNRINTNSRYRNFCQKYFTAGDEEQFCNGRDWTNGVEKEDKKFFSSGKEEFDIWDGYASATGNSVTDTFQYLFHKFKKGIYIRIKDNQVVTFLPFSKAKFVNEWGNRIQFDPKYKDKILFFQHINEMERRPFSPHKVNHFTDEWYANNCLVRYEFPISEGDTGTSHIKNMFEELCREKQVPNLEFFVNRRDFPLLKKDGTEPYDHIFDSDSVPLLSHKYEKYAPILSSVSHNSFADLAIPTIDDWARVKSLEGAFFEKTQNRQFPKTFSMPWEKKKPIAVFRGASTGFGTTIETNPRLKIAYLSSIQKKDEILLDAGITDWNLRPRKIKHCSYLQTIEVDTLPFSLVPKLTPEQQSEFKYIVHIQGHVSAFRLSLEMNMGSVILLVECPYTLWFSQKLRPYEHFVPVKTDLSDLYEKIEWCKNNDDACRKMAENCKKFYDEFLSKNGIFSYLQNLLWQTKKKVGTFLYPEVFPWKKILLEDCAWVLANATSAPFSSKKLRVLKETRNTIVYDVLLPSCSPMAVKFSKEKQHELLREVFIFEQGKLKGLPNFVQFLGLCHDDDKDNLNCGVAMEKVDGESYYTWLQRYEDLPRQKEMFVSILSQLIFAIYSVQVRSGFVHNDLMPWNILIQTLDKPVTPTYSILGQTFTLAPTWVKPIIIDYGKAHIVGDDNRHHGFVNPFAMSDLHDLYFLIFSSVGTILGANKKKFFFSKHTEDFFLRLINFFVPSKGLLEPCTSFGKLKHFLSNHASFSAMTNFVFQCTKTKKNLLDFATMFISFTTASESPSFAVPAPLQGKTTLLQNITTLPCLEFKNKLLVYYFFQVLDSPRFFPIFEKYLQETPDEVLPEIFLCAPEQMSNEIFLQKKEMKKDVHCKIFLNEKLFLKPKVLSYSGMFQVSDKHKLLFSCVYDTPSAFDVFHHLANTFTL